MSSAETPDNRDEPPFDLRRWFAKVAMFMGAVGVGLIVVFFRRKVR